MKFNTFEDICASLELERDNIMALSTFFRFYPKLDGLLNQCNFESFSLVNQAITTVPEFERSDLSIMYLFFNIRIESRQLITYQNFGTTNFTVFFGWSGGKGDPPIVSVVLNHIPTKNFSGANAYYIEPYKNQNAICNYISVPNDKRTYTVVSANGLKITAPNNMYWYELQADEIYDEENY